MYFWILETLLTIGRAARLRLRLQPRLRLGQRRRSGEEAFRLTLGWASWIASSPWTDSSGISCEQEIRKRPTLSRVAVERLQRPSPWFRPRRRLTRTWLAQSGSFADIVVS